MDFKMYGAFRSGTNYFKTLCELNYDVRVLNSNGGFKHTPVPALFSAEGWVRPTIPVLGVVKNPWSWLPSLWRYAQGRGSIHVLGASTWEAFIGSPLEIRHGNYEGFPRQWFRTPVDYWLAMAASLASIDAHIVRYEDALLEPLGTCSMLAKEYGLDRITTEFAIPQRRTRNMGDRRRTRLDEYVTDEAFDRGYYEEHRYLDEYTETSREAVAGLLEPAVVVAVGYDVNP